MLSEAGLPEGHIPLALLLYSVGVEFGHFAFIAVVIAAIRLGRWAVGELSPTALNPRREGDPEPGEAEADPGRVAREMRLRGQSLEGGPSRSGQWPFTESSPVPGIAA